MEPPTSPTHAEMETTIWAPDRFSEEGADIVRDIKLANFRSQQVETRARSQSYSGNWDSMRSVGDEILSKGAIATPGGFRRSFVEEKFDLKFEFEPFNTSTCFFDEAMPTLAAEPAEGDFIKGNIIGIGGGVGPAAGVALHSKIIENTVTDGTDQSHFEVYHLSRSNDLPDRTRYVLGLSDVNPADGLARTMKALNAASSSFGQQAVAGIPCNTFHAPPIWSSFVEQVKEHCGTRVKVVHMLKETLSFIQDALPNVRKIGIMSTTGTREVRVYDELLEANGFEVVWVPADAQAGLHDAIYNKEWGIKAVFPVTEIARKKFLGYSHYLARQGAEAIILGCTEIPLALPEPVLEGTSIVLVDPVLALARALIREADPVKLKPLEKIQVDNEDNESIMSSDAYQEELETVSHVDGSEWQDEVELEKGWDQHFEGRTGQDVELHHLLRQQQLDIAHLRKKMDTLVTTKSEGRSADDLGFTSLRKLQPRSAKKSGETVNVVIGSTKTPLTEEIKLALTGTRSAGNTPNLTGRDGQVNEILGLGASANVAVQKHDLKLEPEIKSVQVTKPSSSPEKTESTDDVPVSSKELQKYMKIMVALTIFCCLLLLATSVLAYHIFSGRSQSEL